MISHNNSISEPFSNRFEQYQWNLDPNGAVSLLRIDSSSVPSSSVVYSKSFVGGPVVKGDFKTPLPHSYSWSSVDSPLSDLSVTNYVSGRLDSTSLIKEQFRTPDYPPHLELDYDSQYNFLVKKLYEEIRGDLDLSITAFQAKQTREMFKITKSFESFIRSRSWVKKAIKGSGSLWLQYAYGWKPFVSDIFALSNESLRYHSNHLQKLKSSSRRISTVSTSRNYPHPTYGGDGRLLVNSLTESKMKIGIHFRGDSQASLDRFTSLNPLSIAWELLPYSFVVDWCLDVGSYLRSAESSYLYSDNFVDGYVSHLVRKSQTGEFRWSKGSSNFLGSVSTSGSRVETTFSRRVLLSTPFPRPPSLNVQLGSSRLFSLASLLSNSLRR